MRVLVVGAGIGGLTTALSLHAAGIEAVVVDAVRELRPLGVGINLLPHATAELAALGLADRLAELAVPTAEVVHFDRFGNEIWRAPRGVAAGHRWPQYSVHRGELQAMLLAAVRERLGPGAVRTGHRFVSATEIPGGVRTRLCERDGGGVTEVETDLLVGADGLHSTVRAQLYPGEGPPRWNGIRMWRGVAVARPFLSGASMAFAGSNHAAKFVVYPISRASRSGRTLLNWVAEVRLPDGDAEAADWNRVGHPADVLPHYRGWRFAGVDVAELVTASDHILEYPMVDRDPLPHWTIGRITLVGDAAHPMYPIGSNGGSQAVLDARVLAAELARAGDAQAGARAYEAARLTPVNEIVLANRDMPMDRILRAVAERAPDGFDRIEDVLTPEELAAIAEGYGRTSTVR
ncbi:flavin-dependent oxidoreductase [Nocardia blacklockiae]|uniref:flavin-dependent oxidoreductase n=1 Tax=Nocardia blacklockiae TaxID=480036 RepID=UPI001894D13A|nr:flavin-dependent oxidoreductase [Nocardia blacklockiae]MBF6175953.1 flavin-dependent oxidoreductase [Nocardia blacklockiae]